MMLRLDRVARALDLAARRRRRAKRGQLLVDRLLELLGRVSGTRGRLDLEHRSEDQRVLLRRHVLRDLLLVDQLLVQPARAAAAENRRGDVRIGVARLEDRRRQPRHVDARQLDARLHDLAPLGRDLRRLRLDRRNGRAALQRAEVLLDQRLRLRRVEVADDRQARVVGRVVLLEESLHVVELRRLDVLVRADDVAVVRMPLREQRLKQRLFGEAVRLVLDALAPLVADDVLLVRQRRLIDLVEQVAHAIGLEPQRQLELVRRDGLEVVGAVEVGRAVDVARAGGLEQLEVRVARARASSSETSCARTGARNPVRPGSSFAGPT